MFTYVINSEIWPDFIQLFLCDTMWYNMRVLLWYRGAVAQDGRIEPGDMILEVNGVSFENMSNDDAVRTLREAVTKPG